MVDLSDHGTVIDETAGDAAAAAGSAPKVKPTGFSSSPVVREECRREVDV